MESQNFVHSKSDAGGESVHQMGQLQYQELRIVHFTKLRFFAFFQRLSLHFNYIRADGLKFIHSLYYLQFYWFPIIHKQKNSSNYEGLH